MPSPDNRRKGPFFLSWTLRLPHFPLALTRLTISGFKTHRNVARTVKTQPFLSCLPLWPGAIDKEKSINTLVFSVSLHLQHSFLSPGALLNSPLRSGRFYNWPFSTTCASAPLSDQHGNLWFPCRFTIFPDIILDKRATRERVCLAVSHLSCIRNTFTEKRYHRWTSAGFVVYNQNTLLHCFMDLADNVVWKNMHLVIKLTVPMAASRLRKTQMEGVCQGKSCKLKWNDRKKFTCNSLWETKCFSRPGRQKFIY